MSLNWNTDDTIVGIATAPGRGGIAVVRVSGAQALKVAMQLFKRHDEKAAWRSHQFYYGQIGDIDNGMAVWFKAPNSYTGEEIVEFHGHGGEVAPRAVMQAALNYPGVRQAEPGEFTFRAFLNGKLNLAQAEAVEELVEAQSELARRLALARLRGNEQDKLKVCCDNLSELIAHVEAALDFPEDELKPKSLAQVALALSPIRQTLNGWLESGAWSRWGRDGVTICIAGPANVGKSTLFNALLKEQRALIDSQPGTTRDYLEARLELEGVAVRLIDTAGFRPEGHKLDSLETAGIRLSQEQLKNTDLLLWVQAPQIALEPPEGIETIEVINKIDLLDAASFAAMQYEKPECHYIVANRGDGVEKLRKTLSAWLSERAKQAADCQFSLNDRQQSLLERGIVALDESIQACKLGQEELVAETLWQTLRTLEEFGGKSLAPQVIESIFENFCIGK